MSTSMNHIGANVRAGRNGNRNEDNQVRRVAIFVICLLTENI